MRCSVIPVNLAARCTPSRWRASSVTGRSVAAAPCRNMRKRLTKIEAAKEKQARGDNLTPEQEESIAGESALREEMRALGADDV